MLQGQGHVLSSVSLVCENETVSLQRWWCDRGSAGISLSVSPSQQSIVSYTLSCLVSLVFGNATNRFHGISFVRQCL